MLREVPLMLLFKMVWSGSKIEILTATLVLVGYKVSVLSNAMRYTPCSSLPPRTCAQKLRKLFGLPSLSGHRKHQCLIRLLVLFDEYTCSLHFKHIYINHFINTNTTRSTSVSTRNHLLHVDGVNQEASTLLSFSSE